MFIIEEILVYDEKNNCIWHNHLPEDKLVVPPTASRLLELLINNHGNLMSRSQLLDAIWTQYGISPSNNTLNQYIFLLRGIFEKIGLGSDVIITIPRKGFMLKEGLKIEKEVSHISNEPVVEEESKEKSLDKSYDLVNFFLIITFILIILLAVFFHSNDNFSLYKLGSVGECSVYILHEDSDFNDVIKMKAASTMIKKYASCRKGDIFIYHPSDSVVVTGNGPAFLTRCSLQKDGTGEYEGCYDVYEFATK
ncbi:winged helix-turn-helix domain-containing protein [Enterobacter bugandensis]|uniref:winged helix-turn-helix domain-containing protein n=1 Tax=Enterobacter bugandensis TaxID=881260 RepID=UPI0022E405C8|nr:winged helix-turn-helix domain-containing protein [Enterobacter bugandensis]